MSDNSFPLAPQRRALLIVLSGPSGVGKDAVIAKMRQLECPLHCMVTATTRPQRTGERDGIDYYFISKERFQKMVSKGEFLEWAEIYGNWYGVPKREVKQALTEGKDVIVKVDVNGAATIKRLLPQAILIFLAPPSLEDLKQRLGERNTEFAEDLELRVKKANEEMSSLPMFDYIVVNHQDKIDLAVSQIDAIIQAEKCRVNRQSLVL